MIKIFMAIACTAAFFVAAPIESADAQTLVVKRGHGHHGYVHHPRKKKVVVIDRGRHHGWRHRNVRRGHGHMHHNHRSRGVGITIR